MRKFLTVVVMFLLCQYSIGVLADNQMYLSGPNAQPGQTVELTLNLKNTDPVSSWACALYLPEGIVFNQLSANTNRYSYKPELVDTRATNDGGTMCSVMCKYNDGVFSTLTGTEGAIATISISVPEDFAPGDYNIEIKRISLSSPDAVSLSVNETSTFAWKVLDADTPSQKDNQMYLTGPNAKPGQMVELTLNLKNTDLVAAWACALYFPEGIVFNQLSVDTNRYPKKPEVYNSLPTNDGGTLCFVSCGTSSNSNLTGTDGAIAMISISVPEDYPLGDYNIEMKRISLSSYDGVSLPVNETSTFVLKVVDTDNPTLKCDLNGDGGVDAGDIMTIINNIADEIYYAAADLNNDGFVDVGDIMVVINTIIGTYDNSAGVKAMSGLTDTMPATENNDCLTITNEDNIVSIQLDNEFEYSAFQMLVTLPDGVDIDDVIFNSDRLDGFTKFAKKVNDGQYIIIGFSMDGNVIAGSAGKILSISTIGSADNNIIISDPIFSIPEAKSYKLQVDDSTNLQGIQCAQISVRGNSVYVHANNDATLNIYSVCGALCERKCLHPGVNTITLRRGQYIINNHKVIISK